MNQETENNINPSATYYYFFSTPLGYGAFLFKDKPFQLIKVFLPETNKTQLMEKISGRVVESCPPDERILKIQALVLNYFQGQPIQISFEDLCLSDFTLLGQSVLKAVYEIPYGQTSSYGDIAKKVGRPKAARFVGTTMANNPFPLLIPCHRVIKSDGSLGKFGGGTAMKAGLIQNEREN